MLVSSLTMSVSKMILFLFLINYCPCQSQKRKFSWKITNLWSSCSATCGLGSSYKLTACYIKTFYGTKEKVEEAKCKELKKPDNRIVKSCFYGKCPKKDKGEFIWKVSEWSACSKSCGGGGIRTRDVICSLALRSGSLLESALSNCISNIEPNKSEMCGYNDCSPEFVTTPWNKCTRVQECRPGIRRRKMKCIVTLGNSKSITVSSGHCYRLGKPPVAWEFCINDPTYHEKCNLKQKIEQMKVPIISTNNFKVHQMRKMNKLRLIIGQTAHVLPYTSVVIKCQVKHFPASNLLWIKNNATYKYIGKIDSRIFVTRRGVLIIKKFLIIDEGIWYCRANKVSESITLFIKSPSKGFEEWVFRNFYRKENVVKMKYNVQYIKAISYQWIVTLWNVCSQTCGEEGIQTREVNCEELESQYFLEVNESLCHDSKFTKPHSTRKCNGMKYCPEWTVLKTPYSKCSDICIGIDSAFLDIVVLCTLKDKSLPDSSCDHFKKPSPNCYNSKCIVYWKIGKWSKCSKSCGKEGIKSRSINCLWKNDNRPAGNLCYQNNLEIPLVLSACSPPQCNLGCLDLSKYCGVKTLCWNNRYRFICCRTCYED